MSASAHPLVLCVEFMLLERVENGVRGSSAFVGGVAATHPCPGQPLPPILPPHHCCLAQAPPIALVRLLNLARVPRQRCRSHMFPCHTF